MERRVGLITGGNAGIGRAAAMALAAAGVRVVIACRSAERGGAALATIRREVPQADVSMIVMDLASQQSIREGCAAFRAAGLAKLDLLIHNAAEFDLGQRSPAVSPDGIEKIWATNHLGPVLLTHLLDPEHSRSQEARVIMVSSQGLMLHPWLKVNFTDPEFRQGGFRVDKAYYQSKLAQEVYTRWLAENYRGTNKRALCIRVTNVKIDLARYPQLSAIERWLYFWKSQFAITPEKMAASYVRLALDDAFQAASGMLVDHGCRPLAARRWAQDPSTVDQLMSLTRSYLPELPGQRSL